MTTTVLETSVSRPAKSRGNGLLLEREISFSNRDVGGLFWAMLLGVLNLVLVSQLGAMLRNDPLLLVNAPGMYGFVGQVKCIVIIGTFHNYSLKNEIYIFLLLFSPMFSQFYPVFSAYAILYNAIPVVRRNILNFRNKGINTRQTRRQEWYILNI